MYLEKLTHHTYYYLGSPIVIVRTRFFLFKMN
jgi:hypothetical protein